MATKTPAPARKTGARSSTTSRRPGGAPARSAGKPAPRNAATRAPAGRAAAPADREPADFDGAFRALKAVLERHVHSLQVLFNTPENYTLASRRLDAKGQPHHFGAVLRKKGYVSFHLMPLYCFPDMVAGVSPELKKRMQGKSCFNFTRPDAPLLVQLDQLTRAGLMRFRQAGMA